MTAFVETYTLTINNGLPVAITCHRCGCTSYNHQDIEYRYCARCHRFHDERTEEVDATR